MKNNSFTNKLFKFIQTNNSVNAVNAAHELLDINVTGPYGELSLICYLLVHLLCINKLTINSFIFCQNLKVL